MRVCEGSLLAGLGEARSDYGAGKGREEFPAMSLRGKVSLATPACPQGLGTGISSPEKLKLCKRTQRRRFLLWEPQHCGAGCPERLCHLHSWRFSRTD